MFQQINLDTVTYGDNIRECETTGRQFGGQSTPKIGGHAVDSSGHHIMLRSFGSGNLEVHDKSD